MAATSAERRCSRNISDGCEQRRAALEISEGSLRLNRQWALLKPVMSPGRQAEVLLPALRDKVTRRRHASTTNGSWHLHCCSKHRRNSRRCIIFYAREGKRMTQPKTMHLSKHPAARRPRQRQRLDKSGFLMWHLFLVNSLNPKRFVWGEHPIALTHHFCASLNYDSQNIWSLQARLCGK